MKPNRAWLLGVLVILSCQRADAPLLTPVE